MLAIVVNHIRLPIDKINNNNIIIIIGEKKSKYCI